MIRYAYTDGVVILLPGTVPKEMCNSNFFGKTKTTNTMSKSLSHENK